MARQELRPHQREAVDAVTRALGLPADGRVPAGGLRTQVVMATGSGKTLVAVRSAARLRAARVLVLVPTLDLLTQTADAWRAGGRTGPLLGLCSLREREAGMPTTTSGAALAARGARGPRLTVFATYASLAAGTVERAHRAGLPAWDLIVVDEAHRTSGRIGKPWAVVHDDRRIPALRRLYLTATPRVWADPTGAGAGRDGGTPAPVASMEDDPRGPFGARCHTLTLSEAIDRGICAPYRVLCVDIADPAFRAALARGADARGDAVRGSRLAALQTALVTASVAGGFRRTLVFHHLTREAEAFAAGLPAVARRLRAAHRGPDPTPPHRIRADWLSGAHSAAHRRRTLAAFARDRPGEKAYLGSVRVLGEGVDIRDCDSVFWADLRGSMPDLVQAVGRALRIRPGQGKVATLVVPVLHGPGEDVESMLTSRAYADLARLLAALRAHDARLVESLAQPQAPGGVGAAAGSAAPGVAEVPGAGARGLLEFSVPRDPALLASFVRLRVIDPERRHWRRGLEAARTYRRAHGDLRVPFVFRAPAGDGAWPVGTAGFPLGQWVADARRGRRAGTLSVARIGELDALGMVWSVPDRSFADGLDVARRWAAAHGHLSPPVDAVWEGAPVGIWVKNQRAAARRGPAGLSAERRAALEAVDPCWCPEWDSGWQRAFHLTRAHLRAGGGLPTPAGGVVAQGEDLGVWVAAQRAGWDRLSEPQQRLLERELGMDPDGSGEAGARSAGRGHAARWLTSWEAARAFRDREGHLRVPRGHVERAPEGGPVRLGVWVANQRARAEDLSPERRTALEALGMEWAQAASGRQR
ncbi:Helicase associated domain protein [Streptomyces sp. BI20]|uniref:DEAD/DEAH box helicase n=1 Tax=Streptomyces sp. BI20 TaxID=3403460 RepID=UPI003C777768